MIVLLVIIIALLVCLVAGVGILFWFFLRLERKMQDILGGMEILARVSTGKTMKALKESKGMNTPLSDMSAPGY